jgi:hypothetical protein
MAQDDFKGTVCPQGHMCKHRTFLKQHHCDLCSVEIESGKSCKLCDYDVCSSCSALSAFREIVYEQVSLAAVVPLAEPIVPVIHTSVVEPAVPVVQSSTDVIFVSSASPPRPKLHPFFLQRILAIPSITSEQLPLTFHCTSRQVSGLDVPLPDDRQALQHGLNMSSLTSELQLPTSHSESRLPSAFVDPGQPNYEDHVDVPRYSRLKLKKRLLSTPFTLLTAPEPALAAAMPRISHECIFFATARTPPKLLPFNSPPNPRDRLRLTKRLDVADELSPRQLVPQDVFPRTCESAVSAVQTSPLLLQTCDAAVQTSFQEPSETPLTLQNLRDEMRALLVGLGF